MLDANVLVSGAVSSTGPIAAVLDSWLLERRIIVIGSDLLLDEVDRALRRPFFATRIDAADRVAYVELIRQEAHRVPARIDLTKVDVDPDDRHVLAAAVDGRAEHIVTGDAALLRLGSFRGIRLTRPRELMDILRAS